MKKPNSILYRLLLLILSITFLCLSSSTVSWAAPEDRGAQGGIFAFSAGGFLATGTQEEGVRLPSQLGSSFRLALGEEVMPKLFVGIALDSYFDGSGPADEAARTQLFAFGFEGRYRLTGEKMGLLLIGGLGIGAGAFMKQGETLTSADASGGGSVWKLGFAYELGSKIPDGVKYLPYILFQRVGPQMDNQVEISMLSFGIELLFAGGRD